MRYRRTLASICDEVIEGMPPESVVPHNKRIAYFHNEVFQRYVQQ